MDVLEGDIPSLPISVDQHAFIECLTRGPTYQFAEWPAGNVPRTGAVVYTIWDREGIFIYVGMSGRGFTGEAESTSKVGPWGRLNAHASGRRSGNQFCVYLCDRVVLPRLHNRILEIAQGTLSLDAATQDYIKANLSFRWAAMESANAARDLERRLRQGEASCGKPMLNPL